MSGAATLDLLTEGTFLSLERGGLLVGYAKRTLIAQVSAVIVHERECVWFLAVERSCARYFADWLTAAAGKRSGCTMVWCLPFAGTRVGARLRTASGVNHATQSGIERHGRAADQNS